MPHKAAFPISHSWIDPFAFADMRWAQCSHAKTGLQLLHGCPAKSMAANLFAKRAYFPMAQSAPIKGKMKMARNRKSKAAPKAAPAPAMIEAPAPMEAPALEAAPEARFAEAEAKAKAEAPAPRLFPGQDISRDAEFHFSGLAHNMPSPDDIQKGDGKCRRMLARDLERYRAALRGEMPIGPFNGSPIDLNLQTHSGYRGKWKQLSALIAARDLAALEAWNSGLGIRMNSSSSIPLGRFHQCAMLAMRAQARNAAENKESDPGEFAGDPLADFNPAGE